MTIRFLSNYSKYKANDIDTLAVAVETALVSAGLASTSLTVGTQYVDPVVLVPVVTEVLSVNNNVYTKAQRGSLPTIAYATTLTLDFSASNSFNIGTLTGNVTLANPTGLPSVGVTQSGSIYFKQDATGSRLLTLGTSFKWAGTAGALSTAANTKDRLDYVVDQDGLINVSLAKGIA